MWVCIRMMYDMALDQVNSRWRAPNKKKTSTATGPFGLLDRTNSLAGMCPVFKHRNSIHFQMKKKCMKRSCHYWKSFCYCSEIIKCGDTIRIQHLATSKNLHSHHFQSPLSGNQEISCYGENGKFLICKWSTAAILLSDSNSSFRFFFVELGVGDSGDHWQVECSSDEWKRSYPVKFHHIDTDVYLSVSGRTFGRPINGQMEVIGVGNSYSATEWKTAEGLFIHPNIGKDSKPIHTEL